MQELKSQLDKSVNFVEEELKGFIESRYVRRADHYFACYLSSQSGCNKGCKFCHLTATKQTSFADVDEKGFLEQAEHVFSHYRNERLRSNAPAKIVHYSFMARGEVMANQNILRNADSILYKLGQKAVFENLNPKFNVSTIMPRTFRSLTEIFKIITPTIYYSLYSANEEFRKIWLPAAMPVEQALDILAEYQNVSKKIVKIHYAFIKGQNDSIEDLEKICNLIDDVGLVCQFNLVRYNPFSSEQGEESEPEVLERNLEYMRSRLTKVKMVSRVGFDVNASCGMFSGKTDVTN